MRKKSKYAQKQVDRGYVANEKSKVAKFANPRQARPTKAEYNLQRRLKDWDGIQAKNKQSAKSGRWAFHRPGSLQR